MTEKEIFSIIDEITPGGSGGDKRYLTNALDICLWVEPRDMCFSVDNKGNTKVYYAAENHGFFTVEPEYELSMKKGTSVIKLVGQTRGTSYVRPAGPPPYRSVNWDHCDAVAVVPNTRDDCFCKWSIWSIQRNGVISLDTHLKMETAEF